MIIEDRLQVEASQEEVWEFLLNIESLASCLPGCEEVKDLGEGVYEAIVAVQIAFMKLRFKVNVQITEMHPPQQLLAEMEGKPLSLVGQLKTKAKMELTAISESETELYYHMDIIVTGKLGSLGQSAFRSKAVELGQQFAENISATLVKK